MPDSNWYTGHESSIKARHIHSINIDGYNTWDEWHLIPSSRPVVNPPAKKRNTIDVPGGNGVIDESDSLRRYPVYDVRAGSWEFYVSNGIDNSYWDGSFSVSSGELWQTRYTEIMDAIHGIQCKVVLDDDPSWYYYGTVLVNEWKSNKDRSIIVIDYELYPYKLYQVTSTNQDWLWDPFNFETDWIYSRPPYEDPTTHEITYCGLNLLSINSVSNWITMEYSDGYFGRLPVSPKVIVSDSTDGISVRLDNPELGIAKEDFYHYENNILVPGYLVRNTTGAKIPNFTLSTVKKTNKNKIYLKGVGTISFDFRVGRL